MTLLEKERQALAAEPSHDELVLRLRGVVKEALSAGTHPAEILAALEDLRSTDPQHADVILDVMDFVAGWSSPHMTLRQAQA